MSLGPNQKPCPTCGSPMHRQSRRCQKCFFKKVAATVLLRQCRVCQRKFTMTRSQLNHSAGLYCSRSCARSGSPTRKKRLKKVTCQYCGKQYLRHPNQATSRTLGKSFCSRACWESWHVRDNHVLYEGGQHERVNPDYNAWRKAVLKRDGKRCRRCMDTRQLQAHHIKRFATHPECRWEVSNGITLCRGCHLLFRYKEEEYEDALTRIAATPHYYCETLEDLYNAVAELGPC